MNIFPENFSDQHNTAIHQMERYLNCLHNMTDDLAEQLLDDPSEPDIRRDQQISLWGQYQNFLGEMYETAFGIIVVAKAAPKKYPSRMKDGSPARPEEVSQLFTELFGKKEVIVLEKMRPKDPITVRVCDPTSPYDGIVFTGDNGNIRLAIEGLFKNIALHQMEKDIPW